jgi:hypothetical protein
MKSLSRSLGSTSRSYLTPLTERTILMAALMVASKALGYSKMTFFMKLRQRLAAIFLGLGNSLSAEAAPATAIVSAEPAQPNLGRGVWLESAQEIAIRQLLETCALAFVSRGKHVRANMMTFSTDGARRQVHQSTAFNMENDPDRNLEIGATAAASGKAVTERRAAIADLVLLQITAAPAWGLRVDEQAKVRATLKSILSVPLFNPEDADGPLLGTLQVDSDLTVEEAGFNKPESAELLQQFADVLSLLISGVHVRVSSVRNTPSAPAPKSRVQNAKQVEPGLYVANSSTSIFQIAQPGSA